MGKVDSSNDSGSLPASMVMGRWRLGCCFGEIDGIGISGLDAIYVDDVAS